jgi:hypothetical protein
MSDRAAATFGGDVLRVGAFSERNCDRGAFVCEPVLDGHRPDRQVVTVDDKISDEFSGLTSALLRNPLWRRQISPLSESTVLQRPAGSGPGHGLARREAAVGTNSGTASASIIWRWRSGRRLR